MENAADALQMAAFVLIFVLALSISINAFGEARQTSQILLDYRDREYDYDWIESNKKEDTTRIVGAETIIPSIYKAYKENYKIVFEGMEQDILYTKKLPSGLGAEQKINYIDLEKEVKGTDQQKEKFIEYLLYGYSDPNDVKIFSDAGITLKPKGIYEESIKDKKFKESLGVYYQEELERQEEGQDNENKPDANKTKKRVITYTQK